MVAEPRQIPATNVSAMLLASAVPLAVAAGFVQSARAAQWGLPAENWTWGLLALVPLEFVRAIVLSNLGDAFRDYQNPQHAVRKFLASIGSLVVMALVWGVFNIGPGAVFALLTNARAYHLLGIPLFVLVADCAVTLYFFRGDARIEAARVQAAADDADDWVFLATFYLPPLLLASFLAYLAGRHSAALSAWFDHPDTAIFLPAVFLYCAAYFCGKAILCARVHTARFDETGERLLGAGWIQGLLMRSKRERAKELEAVRFRKAALSGSPLPSVAVRPRTARVR